MSFRIGQRVRLVKHATAPPRLISAVKVPLGALGEIVGHLDSQTVIVLFDDYKSEWRGTPPGSFSALPLQLEPISDYDGNTVTTWAQSVWKPQSVRA